MNMSYCRFQNTLSDLRDCNYALTDLANGARDAQLSGDELNAAVALVKLCDEIVRSFKNGDDRPITAEEIQTEIERLNDSVIDEDAEIEEEAPARA